MCLVAYAGFMRCDELVKLKGSDGTFNAEGMVVRIESGYLTLSRSLVLYVTVSVGRRAQRR